MSDIENYQGFYRKEALPFLESLMTTFGEKEAARLGLEVSKLVDTLLALQEDYIGDVRAPTRRCALEYEFLQIFMSALPVAYDGLTKNLPGFNRRSGNEG